MAALKCLILLKTETSIRPKNNNVMDLHHSLIWSHHRLTLLLVICNM